MSESIEERIKALEQKNRLLVDNIIDAVWVVDVATMTYDYITPSISRVSGYSAAEIIGKSIRERMSEESYNQIMRAIKYVSSVSVASGVPIFKRRSLENAPP